jgi:cystathionine beta-lyase
MWVADMDFRSPDFVLDALRKRLDHEVLGYTYIPSSFGQSAADWIRRRHGWSIKPSWISFSPGVVPALNLLVMAFTDAGDKIIVQPPVYFPFFSAVRNHGRVLVNNPLKLENGSYVMDFDDLESKMDNRTRMLILCSPHNPTGNVWPPAVLERLGELCLKHNIILVSDEIHADLVFQPHKHIPTASLSKELARRTITCMSPSKTFNLAGLSTAYLVIPDAKVRKQYEKMLDRVHVGAGNIFGHIAQEAAYRSGDEWLEQLMDYLAGNLDLLADFISRRIPQLKLVRPQATYLAWLDFRALGMEQQSLNDFLIRQAGLGLSDGTLFGAEGNGFQRINFGCPRETLHQALLNLQSSIAKFLDNNQTFL